MHSESEYSDIIQTLCPLLALRAIIGEDLI